MELILHKMGEEEAGALTSQGFEVERGHWWGLTLARTPYSALVIMWYNSPADPENIFAHLPPSLCISTTTQIEFNLSPRADPLWLSPYSSLPTERLRCSEVLKVGRIRLEAVGTLEEGLGGVCRGGWWDEAGAKRCIRKLGSHHIHFGPVGGCRLGVAPSRPPLPSSSSPALESCICSWFHHPASSNHSPFPPCFQPTLAWPFLSFVLAFVFSLSVRSMSP